METGTEREKEREAEREKMRLLIGRTKNKTDGQPGNRQTDSQTD